MSTAGPTLFSLFPTWGLSAPGYPRAPNWRGPVLGGRGSFTVDGRTFAHVGGRVNVFGGKPHSVYIPVKTKFSIQAEGAVEIALPSAPRS